MEQSEGREIKGKEVSLEWGEGPEAEENQGYKGKREKEDSQDQLEWEDLPEGLVTRDRLVILALWVLKVNLQLKVSGVRQEHRVMLEPWVDPVIVGKEVLLEDKDFQDRKD